MESDGSWLYSPPVDILSQLNPLHIIRFLSRNVQFNIILLC